MAITIAAAAGLRRAVYCYRRSREFNAAPNDVSRPAWRTDTTLAGFLTIAPVLAAHAAESRLAKRTVGASPTRSQKNIAQ